MVQAPSTWLNDLLNTLTPGQRWMIFPPGVWIMILFGILVSAALRYTRAGRHIFALGSNEQTARLCGVPVHRTKLLIYSLASAFAGLAGVLQFSYLTVGDPTTANGYELSAIAAVVIGGASLLGGEGSIFGTLIGAMIMTAISNGCTKLDLANWVQEIVTGAIIVFAVALDRFRHRKSEST
jgi:ribose/xylose/arabinose/galactoside ABC-type transport system permease subunit